MAEEYTRSEYLKALLNQKKTIVNNDSSLLNPSVRNADDVETNYNANVDSSKVSAGSTDIQNETGTSEQYKEDRNGWQRFWDTVGNFVHNINEGVQKYILDPIFDAGAWVYGEISGDKQGATDAINYDWGAHYLNVIDQLDFGTNIMSGDFFGADGGDYWNNWADTGSIEASRQNFANLKAGSFMSDASPEVQQGFETGEQIFGALLPSIILAIATGGSSAGVQAAAFATQVGVAGVSGFGKGVEEALADGGDYDKAGLYGLARGGTDALLAFAGGKISGQLLNGGVGLKAASKMFGKTGSVMLSKAAQIATNAGISGLTAAVDTALVRPAEKLIYDEQAWAKAYGSESATYNTLMNAGKAGLTAVAMSTLSQGITEAGKRASLGQEKYEAQFIRQMDNASSNISKINSNTDKLNKLSDQMSKAYQKLESGAWTEEQYNAYVSTRLNKFEKISAETSKLWDTYQSKTYSDKVVANYGETVGKIKQDNLNAIAYKMSSNNVMPKAKASAFIKAAMDKGYSWSEIKNGGSVQFTSADGNSVIQVGKNESASLMYVAPKTDKKITIPLQIGYNQENYLAPKSALQVTNALTLVALHKSDLVNSMILKPDTLVSKDVNLPNKKNELIITQEVAKKITTDNTGEQIKEFFEVVSKNKGKTVIPNGKEYIIVNNYTDSNGIKQTAITKVNSKFDTVMSFAIAPSNKVVPSKVATSKTAQMAVSTVVEQEQQYVNEDKYVKAYGEMTHDRVLAMSKSKDIVDIARKQIFSKLVKKDGYTYKLDTPKGKIAHEIFEAFNGDTKDLPAAIDEIATEIAESKLTSISPTGVEIESLAGHKDDLVKAITGLLQAKSELSKVAKLQKRIDLTIEQKNKQIEAIRERANSKIATANEIFEMIKKDLKQQIKDLKVSKKNSNILSRNRDMIKDKVTGDYDYGNIEERDVHTVNMLAKPISSFERNYGNYKATDKTITALLEAQKNFIEENYGMESSIDFDWETKLALDKLIELVKTDLNKPEISPETYEALVDYQKKVLAYEKRLKHIEITQRKPSAYSASTEIDNYDMNRMQKITDIVTKEFGGKAGEVFKKFGFGEVTKKIVIALDQASGDKAEFEHTKISEMVECLFDGFHNKANGGKVNGVELTKGQLISLYIQSELAPVNAENLNIGGFCIKGKKHNEWVFKGEGHLDEIKQEVNSLLSDKEKEFAKKLFDFKNGSLRDSFIESEKAKGKVDVELVKDYWTMTKADKGFSTAADKIVKGEPHFRYSVQRTDDKSGLIIGDAIEETLDYISSLGMEMYLKPKVHDAMALLNSKDQSGMRIRDKIAYKYDDKTVRYLEDLTNAWIIKSRSESQNVITKLTNSLMSGYTVAKLADFVRPVKNFFSYITANPSLGKQAKGYISRFSKEVRDEVNWYIENHIYNLKYRKADNQLLKGNAPTVFKGVRGKVDKILMTPVTTVDYAAMVMGLTTIINDVKLSGANLRDPSVIQYVKDSYSIFNLCNVNGDPNHQNMLNDNALTKVVFNILAGAKRAQVASNAIQMSLWQQNHTITPEMKARMDKELAQAHENRKMSTELREKAEKALEQGYEELIARRAKRDEIANNVVRKISNDENIIGTKTTVDEAKGLLASHIKSVLLENGIDDEVVGVEIIGSRMWGYNRKDSDIDVLVELKGKTKEDSLFNLLNDPDNKIDIDGIEVDINPINANQSMTLSEHLKKDNEYSKSIVQKEFDAKLNEARKAVEEQKNATKDLKDKVKEAEETEARAYSEEKTQQNKQDSYKHYEYAGGKRIPLNMFLKTVIAGALTTAVGIIMNKLYGKKDFGEWTAQEIITSLVTNSFLNWIPVVDTLSGAILNGYDIEAPTVTMLNEFTGTLSKIIDSFKDGKFDQGIVMSAISVLEGLTGLPLDTIRKYIYGIMKMTDLEMAIKFNNLFYTTTLSSSSKSYNSYIENGNTKYAKETLDYIMETYKGNIGNDNINSELVYLSSQGYNAIPSSIPTAYTDENGNTVQLSSAQITQFTQLYKESTEVVNAIIKSSDYKNATAEEQAKLIKSAYSYYYSYAKAKVSGTAGDSKITKLLVMTNGNVNMAEYLVYLQKIGTITENKLKTRKELVLDYINRIKGLNKNEKILLMYLSGFAVSGNSKTQLISYLMKNGSDRATALDFVGGKDD